MRMQLTPEFKHKILSGKAGLEQRAVPYGSGETEFVASITGMRLCGKGGEMVIEFMQNGVPVSFVMSPGVDFTGQDRLVLEFGTGVDCKLKVDLS